MKRLIVLSTIIFSCASLFSQNVFTSVQDGNWDDASTWFLGAGTGGIEGINYPSPSDSVYVQHDIDIVTATSGSDFVFTGYLNVASGDTLRCTVGSSTTGFTLDGSAVMHLYGIFYTAVIGEQPSTATPTAKEFISEGNSNFIAFSGSFLFVADDWAIQENAVAYIEDNVCLRVDDDINFDGTGWTMCGDGDISIGGDGAGSTVNFSNSATDAQICTGTSIVRNTGGTGCTGGGVVTITTGTGPSGNPPTAYDDFISTQINTQVDIDVLDLDTADSDIALDTLTILKAGNNAAIDDNSTANGGIISINDNGTPTNKKDDFIVYSPPAGFEGTDTFQYIIEDEEGLFDTATVTVSVINCGNSYVELQGVGANGSTTATINFTDTTNIDSIRLDLIYKNGKPTSATFTSSAGEVNAGTQIDAINIAGDDDGVYRTTIGSASSVTVTHDNSTGVRSFLAYVYRRGVTSSITSVADDQVVYLFQNSYSFTQNIQAGSGPRNIKIQMPISELNDDSRSALLEVQAGPVYGSLETFSADLGNSLKIFTLILEDVPGDVTELEVTITSRPTGLGDSFVTAGIDFGIQCSGTAIEAEPDFVSTPENTAVTIDILDNDVVGNGGIDTAGITNLGLLDPQNGTVTFNSSGQAVYTPDASFTGVDYFQYQVCDTLQLCDITLVTVTVTCSGGQFAEIASNVGLDLGGNKDGGLSWADFNNDGLIDVIINTNDGTNDTKIYFSNDSSGTITFDDVTSSHASGLNDNINERSVVTGDLNNDGYTDFVRNTYQNTGIEIWFNNGPGATPPYSFGNGSQDENISINTFSTSNNTGDGFNTEGLSIVDWNQDGWLDIIVENDGDGIEILENDKDGTFSEVAHATSGFTAAAGGSNKGDYSTAVDYDNDGFVDYMARRADDADLYHFNSGTSQFDAVAGIDLEAGGEKGGITFCDLDQDGDFDLIWAHEQTSNNTVIYVQAADGTFSVADTLVNDAGVEECDCADVDNDGDNDIFLGDDAGTSYLYKNNTPKGGALSFSQDNDCIDPSADVEGSEFVDYDQDGDMDLYMNINGAANQLWTNGQDDNNYLIVEPRINLGGGKYRSAIGANVMLIENCTDTCMIKDISGGRGHGSQKPYLVHFGLPNGSGRNYKIITFFVDSSGTRDTVIKSVTPSELTGQKLIVYQTDSDFDICVDADNDGIINSVDIDDDNDGILDVDEGFGSNNPAGDEDGDGILNYLDVSDDGSGDGSTTNYTDADGNGIPDVFDTDGDGVPNHFDLDADDDGIPDIVEAGGTDADGDGLVDGTFMDGDNDGWSNVFDSNNGGTALSDPNTDGDSNENRLDLDSDNDGITDLVESGGTDFDGDGRLNTDDPNGNGFKETADTGDGGTSLEDRDVDNDGFENRIDLDSDNDGIGDLVEAGGTDSDGNGIEDIAFADTDNDGWSNTYDKDNGGTVLTDPDTDGDGLNDRIDIDADDDGIVDIIESQASGTLTSPSGNDADNDGIDDNFDSFTGATLTTPENTDGTDNPDYTDTDSDNDGDLDELEGWDTNNNGTANTVRNNIDADNDGLDDAFDDITGPNSTTNVTNSQTSSSFPNLDNTGTSERDWREILDSDGDGIGDVVDIDDDNDGILDVDECFTTFTLSHPLTVNSSTGVTDPANVTASPDGAFADWYTNGNIATLDFGATFAAGTQYVITWRERTGQSGTAEPIFEESTSSGSGFSTNSSTPTTNSTTAVTDTITSQNAFRFIRVSKDDPPSATDFEIDAIGIITGTEECDQDGDGIPNRLDLDSDNDGITDNVEAQTTADFVAPLGTDTDMDGWDDRYDSDDGGTKITLSNRDGVAEPDYLDTDTDGDSNLDWLEAFDDNLNGDATPELLARATAFEVAAGNPMYYVNSDDNNGTNDGDGIPDWLEDDDADNVPNFLDPDNAAYQDTDNDGLVDLLDSDNFGVASNLPDQDGDGEYDFRDSDNDIGALPIELLKFTANKLSNKVALNWTTLTEINNDYFTIERLSKDGNFEPILTHPGAGNSYEVIAYEVYDQSPHIGYNYYRLRQTDFDGTTEAFNVVSVYFEAIESILGIRVYPNPSDGNLLYLELQNSIKQDYNVEIYNSTSQLILTKKLGAEDQERRLINILSGSHLKHGIYYLKIHNTTESKVVKFIVK